MFALAWDNVIHVHEPVVTCRRAESKALVTSLFPKCYRNSPPAEGADTSDEPGVSGLQSEEGSSGNGADLFL